MIHVMMNFIQFIIHDELDERAYLSDNKFSVVQPYQLCCIKTVRVVDNDLLHMFQISSKLYEAWLTYGGKCLTEADSLQVIISVTTPTQPCKPTHYIRQNQQTLTVAVERDLTSS